MSRAASGGNSRSARRVVMTLGVLASCASEPGGFETIRSVPAFVITVDELAGRVGRASQDPLARTHNVQVVGVLLEKGTPCDLTGPPGQWRPPGSPGPVCPPTAAHMFGDPESTRTRIYVLLPKADGLEVGQRYVLSGSVESAPDLPARWALRGDVLARVQN